MMFVTSNNRFDHSVTIQTAAFLEYPFISGFFMCGINIGPPDHTIRVMHGPRAVFLWLSPCDLDGVIFFQNQKIHDSRMLHMPCGYFGVTSVALEQIGPARSLDGPPGVLV